MVHIFKMEQPFLFVNVPDSLSKNILGPSIQGSWHKYRGGEDLYNLHIINSYI